MPRNSYVDPDTVTDPELRPYLDASLPHGTPRIESQAIRAHVPELRRTFNQTWQATFRDGRSSTTGLTEEAAEQVRARP